VRIETQLHAGTSISRTTLSVLVDISADNTAAMNRRR